MSFRFLPVLIVSGLISPAFAQNQPVQSKATHLIIDTVEFYASPYSRNRNIVPPTYPGGIKSFINFLATHMQLPGNLMVSDTKDGKVTDSLYANFEIEKNGTVSGVILTKRDKGI